MTIFDKLFLIGYFLATIFLQAKYQAKRFKANRPISHPWHALLYCITILPVMWFFGWQAIVIGLLERVALFDGLLNWLRKKPLLYNGAGTTGSWLDKWENKLSSVWVAVLKVGYMIVFVTVVIIL